ncbi:MgtC/SapB family protein [Pasteurellaceae bacterium USgator11]|nr:MgtC/SapB family protein [Pasteurellaceae bacterium UScroc12]TNG99193.1 MgtC/SapB family protein [Pasteurellaceae bacterium USgator11]TNG99529.1 MgtC/SapB family protein [Pasteurellaceae bacterium UScroc31]
MNEIKTQLILLGSTFNFTVMFKLLLTCFLGGIIGLEREVKRKPVGIKTCIIIAVTTCILTVVSIRAAEYYAALSSNIRTDPMRLAAQVISGIGFIGTGVILHKNNDMISGITTAAMIWSAAGIGITIGAGFYGDAITVAIIIIITLKYSRYLKIIIPKKNYINKINITLDINSELNIEDITQTIHHKNCQVDTVSIKEENNNHLILSISAYLSKHQSSFEIYKKLKSIQHINGIEIKYFN